MRNLANYLLFQAGWLACVGAAVEGRMWLGPLAVLAIVVLHLALLTQRGRRKRELGYLLAIGALGLVADSLLAALDLVRYPTSVESWPSALVPAWITALWILFATLPAHSMSWLRGRHTLAVLFGAIGGPLSFLAGVRLGAIEPGSHPSWTWLALAVEYAVLMPLMLHFASPAPPTQRRLA